MRFRLTKTLRFLCTIVLPKPAFDIPPSKPDPLYHNYGYHASAYYCPRKSSTNAKSYLDPPSTFDGGFTRSYLDSPFSFRPSSTRAHCPTPTPTRTRTRPQRTGSPRPSTLPSSPASPHASQRARRSPPSRDTEKEISQLCNCDRDSLRDAVDEIGHGSEMACDSQDVRGLRDGEMSVRYRSRCKCLTVPPEVMESACPQCLVTFQPAKPANTITAPGDAPLDRLAHYGGVENVYGEITEEVSGNEHVGVPLFKQTKDINKRNINKDDIIEDYDHVDLNIHDKLACPANVQYHNTRNTQVHAEDSAMAHSLTHEKSRKSLRRSKGRISSQESLGRTVLATISNSPDRQGYEEVEQELWQLTRGPVPHPGHRPRPQGSVELSPIPEDADTTSPSGNIGASTSFLGSCISTSMSAHNRNVGGRPFSDDYLGDGSLGSVGWGSHASSYYSAASRFDEDGGSGFVSGDIQRVSSRSDADSLQYGYTQRRVDSCMLIQDRRPGNEMTLLPAVVLTLPTPELSGPGSPVVGREGLLCVPGVGVAPGGVGLGLAPVNRGGGASGSRGAGGLGIIVREQGDHDEFDRLRRRTRWSFGRREEFEEEGAGGVERGWRGRGLKNDEEGGSRRRGFFGVRFGIGAAAAARKATSTMGTRAGGKRETVVSAIRALWGGFSKMFRSGTERQGLGSADSDTDLDSNLDLDLDLDLGLNLDLDLGRVDSSPHGQRQLPVDFDLNSDGDARQVWRRRLGFCA